MRFPAAVLSCVLLASCYPAKPVSAPSPNAPAAVGRAEPAVGSPALPVTAAAAPPVAAAPSAPAEGPRFGAREISGITFEGVVFDSRSHRLAVVDQPGGPGSVHPDSASAAGSMRGLAAVNAGFFTPEGAPLGLVVSRGKTAGSWNGASSLGSGVWYETTGGEMAISRRDQLGRSRAPSMRELIQAGPLLVENGHTVSGLEGSKSSPRIFILWDGGTRWWIGRASPCSLAALGQALGQGQPAGWKVRQAINLDGGRSADVWVSSAVPGGPFTSRPIWNKPVRNFLVLVAR